MEQQSDPLLMVRPSCATSRPPLKSTGSTAASGSTTASHVHRGPPPMRSGPSRRRSGRKGRPVRYTCALSVRVQRLLRLRRGLQAELARHGPVQGPHRSSAALAGRSGLCGAAGGRHRERRDGRDAGSGDGQGSGSRHDAAAVADLHRLPSGARMPFPLGCIVGCRTVSRTGSRAGRTCS